MTRKNLFRLVAFNLVLIAGNVLLFAAPLLHVQIGASAIQTAIGITAIVISILLFFYVNYTLLTPPKPVLQLDQFKIRDIDTLEECETAVRRFLSLKTFNAPLNTVLKQIDRLKRKRDSITAILLQHFDANSLSYQKFHGAIDSVVDVMCLNIRSIISRVNAFDEEEYMLIKTDRSTMSEKTRMTKLNIYNEYIAFVNAAVSDDEEMIMRLDQLQLELSKLHSFSSGEIEQMGALKDIDQLINDTKWYRQNG